ELHEIKTAWPSVAASTVSFVVHSGEGEPERLGVNFAELGTSDWHANGNDEPTATMIASAATWRSLLAGQTNIITEMTGGRLRCVNKRDTHRIRSDEVHAVAALLGVAPVPIVRAVVGSPVTATPGAPAVL